MLFFPFDPGIFWYRDERWSKRKGSIISAQSYFNKNLVERTRPYDIIDTLQPLVNKPGEYSFLSGHAGSSFAAGFSGGNAAWDRLRLYGDGIVSKNKRAEEKARFKMNPMNIMKIKGLMDQFSASHPRVPMFFRDASQCIGEDSVIDITVTTAEGKILRTNMKVTAQDLELIGQLKNLSN